MLANISPLPISQGYQSTRGIDPRSTGEPSLTSLVTLRHNRPIQRYWHMGNNATGIWATTLLAYDKQRYWHMTNNDSVIWATTISAYDKQRQRDITNNGAGICALRHTTASAYGFMLLCA